MKRVWIFLVALLPLVVPGVANAWHNRGHNAVARIAWQRLIDLKLDRQAIDILNTHPHKELFLLADRPEGVEDDEWMFVQAATWADWVRRPMSSNLDERTARDLADEFNRPVWHYINLPYNHPAEKTPFDEAVLRKQLLEVPLDPSGGPRHVVAAINYNVNKLESAEESLEKRAVAMCWVMHLIGDLHQPLHASGLLAAKGTLGNEELLPPSGDQGGNRLAIRASADVPNASSLHFYWDALVLADIPYATVQARVRTWLADPAFQRGAYANALKKADVLEWAEESHALARAVVYQDGNQFLKVEVLPDRYPRTMLDNLAAPVLSEQYQKRADATAQRQLVLAGYRLADVLAAALEKTAK
jgi:hypothetical protein